MPPRLDTTVGIAVATTVDSIAARKMDSMIPTRTHRFRPSSLMGPPRAWGPSPRPALRLARPSSVPAGATRAAAHAAPHRMGAGDRVPADEVHVLGNTRVGLSEDLETEALLHVPPPIAGCFKRIPARR